MVESKKESHKIRYAIVAVLLVIVVASYFGYRMYFPKVISDASTSGQQWAPVQVTSQNLPNVLESTSVVHDLPDEGVINLKIGSSVYKIEKDSVVAGQADNADLEITLPEKYFEVLGKLGLCETLREATQNNDIGIELKDSTASLAWKYRALGKYKSCIG